MKHTAEQLVIGKAVTDKNFHDALISVENVAAYMGKAYLIDKFQESDPHTFPEKSAEIFRIQRDNGSGILQSDRFHVMRIYIIGYRDEPGAFRIAEASAAIGFRKLIA